MKKLLGNYRYAVDFATGVLSWRGKVWWISAPVARVTFDLLSWMLSEASRIEDEAALCEDKEQAWQLRAKSANIRVWAERPSALLTHEHPEIATRQVWQPYRLDRGSLDFYLEQVVIAAAKPADPVPEFLIVADLGLPEVLALKRVKQIAIFAGSEFEGRVVSEHELDARVIELVRGMQGG